MTDNTNTVQVTPQPCPFCGTNLIRTGEPGRWEWQHLAEDGEGCILHDEAPAHLQDDDDVACWNNRLAQSTPADREGLHLPWRADPDDRPGYEWNWHVLDAKGDRVCFMAVGPDSEAKVRHLVASANALRTAADPEQEVVDRESFRLGYWAGQNDADSYVENCDAAYSAALKQQAGGE